MAAPTSGATAAFNRFCSGALTEPGSLYDPDSATGYRGQLYFGNEENGDEGRDFGDHHGRRCHAAAALGLFSWENTLVAETTGVPPS